MCEFYIQGVSRDTQILVKLETSCLTINSLLAVFETARSHIA